MIYARTPKEMLKSKVVELQPTGNPYTHVAALNLASRRGALKSSCMVPDMGNARFRYAC